MKLLHLDSSIQGSASVSRNISSAIVERLTSRSVPVTVTYRDLAADPLPHISLQGLRSELASAVLDEFLAADIVVIGAALYNFGLATQLKTWCDYILIGGKTFRYGPNGAEGLVGHKKVYVGLARGGLYPVGSPARANEHAETHLRSMLGFIGIHDPQFVVAEGVALGPDHRLTAIDAVLDHIEQIEPIARAA